MGKLRQVVLDFPAGERQDCSRESIYHPCCNPHLHVQLLIPKLKHVPVLLGTCPQGLGAVQLLPCGCSFHLWESFILDERVTCSGCSALYLHLAIVSGEIVPSVGTLAQHHGAVGGQ